uniref:Uncharacterized protein n=1 Tax=Ascaris lumbricoides TaxID=6252 RepID=A0A0M3INX1_ASCLU
MSLPGAVLRHRRSTLQEIVQSLDAFDKTTDEIKEEKKTSGAIISVVCFTVIELVDLREELGSDNNSRRSEFSVVCFTVIGVLVFGELKTYIYGDTEFEYKFTVDTAFDE